MKKSKFNMFFFQLSICITAVFFSALLISCKSDTSTGPPVNSPQTNDSLLFEKDLLMVRAINPPVSSERIIYVHSSLFTKFKLTFKGETNVTDSNNVVIGFALDIDTLFPNPSYYWQKTSPSDINKTWIIQDSTSNLFNVLSIGIGLPNLADSTKYVKLENIKFYKVN